MRAIYRVGLHELPPAEAISLVWMLPRRADSMVARSVVDGWAWNDPVFALIAGVAGLEPPHDDEHELVSLDEVDRLLSAPRYAET